jgi:Ca-activated chloride channel family protein
MVTWDTDNAIILAGYEVGGPNDSFLLDKINAIQAGGGTNLHGGLVAGYDLAMQSYDSQRINRIVLISDGGANAGVTDIELIAEHAGGQNEDGVYMVGAGVGSGGTYHDHLMDEVTDAGKGASVFIADAAEAWKVFHDDFVNTFAVSARDVQVELTLPPGFAFLSFSGEEYSPDPSEVEPQHLAPNDTMVFHQRIEACAPEIVDEASELTVTVRYKDTILFLPRQISDGYTFGELLGGDHTQLLKGAAILAYTDALKAEKHAAPEAGAALEAAFEGLAAAEAALPGDADLAEIRQVLEAL